MAILFVWLLLMVPTVPSVSAAPSEKGRSKKVSLTALICKTGSEKRLPTQPLKLYFQYSLPFIHEPEDPTLPYGRQIPILAGRPVVQLFFEKASGPAGENGELLQPMQCGFSQRPMRSSEPTVVQILLPPGQVHWFSQGIGQKSSAHNENKISLIPAGDWSFAQQFEQVFQLELDDKKNFITSQIPKVL